MVFLQPGNGGLRILLCAVHFSQHNAELNATGVIHLRANNVVVDVETTRGFRKQWGIDRLTGKLQTQHRHAVSEWLRLQTFLVIFRDIQMQGRLNKLLRQRRFRMREHFTYRVLLDQFAIADDRHAITNALHNVHFVSDQQNRQTQTAVDVFQQFENRTCRCRVQRAGGFITQQYFGIAG